MDPLSLSSVSEQARENNVNNKFLLPRKPVSYAAVVHLVLFSLKVKFD